MLSNIVINIDVMYYKKPPKYIFFQCLLSKFKIFILLGAAFWLPLLILDKFLLEIDEGDLFSVSSPRPSLPR